MGSWGGGIYDSDHAVDLKATIEGIVRAPISDDAMLDELWATHGDGAEDLEAMDYWLVLASEFERRGLFRDAVAERALAIIAEERDIAELSDLGAEDDTLAARRRDAAKLRARLENPRPARPRRVVKKPQPLLFEVGTAICWPTRDGEAINPYSPTADPEVAGFAPNGWGFGVIGAAGHLFHVLAYHALWPLKWRRNARPSADLAIHCARADLRCGTLTKAQVRKMGIEALGPVAPEAMGPLPADLAASARTAVIGGIGLSNAIMLDAWNLYQPTALKFPIPAPSATPIDPDEPDQRPPPPGAHGLY
ncbi:MAG: hypothetical protein AAF577_17575 [Pseudomonadota bacterium]